MSRESAELASQQRNRFLDKVGLSKTGALGELSGVCFNSSQKMLPSETRGRHEAAGYIRHSIGRLILITVNDSQ